MNATIFNLRCFLAHFGCLWKCASIGRGAPPPVLCQQNFFSSYDSRQAINGATTTVGCIHLPDCNYMEFCRATARGSSGCLAAIPIGIGFPYCGTQFTRRTCSSTHVVMSGSSELETGYVDLLSYFNIGLSCVRESPIH